MVCTLVPVVYWKLRLQGGKLRVSEWRKGQSGGIYGDTDRGIVPEQDERPKVSESSLERASGSSIGRSGGSGLLPCILVCCCYYSFESPSATLSS